MSKAPSKAKQACLAYLGNRGIYEEVKRAAFFQGLWFIVFENCPGEVEVSFSGGFYECYDIYPAKGFAWSKSNLAKIKSNLEGGK